ncbi:MAG TPA: hypothetical protein VFV11_05110 [Solimonas sp.]|nr:hypothetical protein [Solimonas sp.]
MLADTLPFAVQLTADRKYLTVRIPVASLPADLRKRPSAMNVRLLPETVDARRQAGVRWMPEFLLGLMRS